MVEPIGSHFKNSESWRAWLSRLIQSDFVGEIIHLETVNDAKAIDDPATAASRYEVLDDLRRTLLGPESKYDMQSYYMDFSPLDGMPKDVQYAVHHLVRQ